MTPGQDSDFTLEGTARTLTVLGLALALMLGMGGTTAGDTVPVPPSHTGCGAAPGDTAAPLLPAASHARTCR